MGKSRIGFSVFAALALAVAPALPAVAAPTATEQAAAHVTAGSAQTMPRILGVPHNTVMGDLDGICEGDPQLGELCVSYTYPMFTGSIADFLWADCNLQDNVFLSPGTGQGQVVAGNIKGAINLDGSYAAQFWTQPNCTGDSGVLPPGNSLFNPGNTPTPWKSFTWIWWGCC